MTINKGAIIVSLLALELVVYSLRFVKIEPETKLLPSTEALQTISDYNGYKKLNSACISPPNFNYNQVNLLNSQNINGYNPIFPKRLLKVVNATLGRDVNWVETVSLSMNSINGSLFRIAGVIPCIENDKVIEEPSSQNNIFIKLDKVEDDLFYSLAKEYPEDIGKQSVIVLRSDSALWPEALDNSCKDKSQPEVQVAGENEIQVKSECDFYYVNPQLFYKGWVMLDEENRVEKAFPAFGFLQGYKVSAGNRKVRFAFKPFSFYRQL